jgi:hypothetical protein
MITMNRAYMWSFVFNLPIENFLFIFSNIIAAPAYGVYISQLIRYSRACGSYQDFLDRRLLLTRKLKVSFLISPHCQFRGVGQGMKVTLELVMESPNENKSVLQI